MMAAPSAPFEGFRPDDLDPRITVHEGLQAIEIDLRGLDIRTAAAAGAFYDRVEARIAETGEPLWFFLIHSGDYRVDPSAWFAFTRRGRDVQEAHSMGTVRVDGTDIARRQIARDEARGVRDPNVFVERGQALERLRRLPSRRRERVVHEPSFEREAIRRRVQLEPETGIAHIDLSGLSLEHSRDVNDVFGWLEEILRPTGRRWWFLIDYTGTRIQSPAWVQYSLRGKDMNARYSLGSVRFAPGSETETDIRLRAASGGFRPNIRNTREEALARIAELKAEAGR
ncbi:hypothetical protein [Wenxinia marina]|uniref:Uncharacterized protein n=1 Tax=Wenxinia marina DSM 24838 TaxID=1123501 RepID=A0A0D0NT38_9RHOB|nr:hypothetical protein [Wenxinia marina]KIQ71365.1 hypothetical protein Wenmar_00143 [Wenxinia marina DSM 24838]GGL81306.1 hypothetical protein GCM10011392_39880 [Wenxinia marina]